MLNFATNNKGKRIMQLKLNITFIVLALAGILLVGATFAWILISRTPIVSNLGLSVLTLNRLEIAPDNNGVPGEWDVILDLSTVLEDLSPLKPVTYSNSRNQFYAMNYGLDGRADGATIALSDDVNANVQSNGSATGTDNGYYIAVKFWMRAPSTADIYLSEAKEVEEGTAGTGTYVIGNPVWNNTTITHDNGGNGMETALRLGFLCQSTDLDGNPVGNSEFFIYEPNCDTHVDSTTGYIDTDSIDGGTGLIDSAHLITQTTSTWNETTPVLNSSVLYSMGNFQTNTKLFHITNTTMEKITLYLWVEGQDIDCRNTKSAYPTSVLANIQFTSNEDNNATGITRDE